MLITSVQSLSRSCAVLLALHFYKKNESLEMLSHVLVFSGVKTKRSLNP